MENNIRLARKQKGLGQKELAEKIGVALDTVSRWENNVREPKISDIKNIAHVLGVSVDYLLANTQEEKQSESNVRNTKMLEIPLLDIATAASCGVGNGLSGVDLQAGETIFIEYSDLQRYDDLRKPFAIHTEGDSMEGAGLEEGSVAVINPAEDVLSGDMALIVWNDNWFVKWVVWNPDGSVELRSANPNYATITVDKEYASDANWFRVVGKVVSIIKRSKPRRAF